MSVRELAHAIPRHPGAAIYDFGSAVIERKIYGGGCCTVCSAFLRVVRLRSREISETRHQEVRPECIVLIRNGRRCFDPARCAVLTGDGDEKHALHSVGVCAERRDVRYVFACRQTGNFIFGLD